MLLLRSGVSRSKVSPLLPVYEQRTHPNLRLLFDSIAQKAAMTEARVRANLPNCTCFFSQRPSKNQC